ncbi:hypothetical protein [Streptomyces sp. NPDC056661]|uniref:hypothetical protein n=1 Tax=Streptomyces sp. NPDC056661 TaxID=3345898 RepID=UPI003697A754
MKAVADWINLRPGFAVAYVVTGISQTMGAHVSYSMIAYGALQLPAGRWPDLAASGLDPWSQEYWLGSLRPYIKNGPETAGALVEMLAEHCEFQVEAGDEGLRVVGILGEDAFLDLGCYLAEAFRAGSGLGKSGELWFLEEQTIFTPQQPELSYRISMNNGQAQITHPTEEEQERLLATPGLTDLIAGMYDIDLSDL